jgi:hypothetical protein
MLDGMTIHTQNSHRLVCLAVQVVDSKTGNAILPARLTEWEIEKMVRRILSVQPLNPGEFVGELAALRVSLGIFVLQCVKMSRPLPGHSGIHA